MFEAMEIRDIILSILVLSLVFGGMDLTILPTMIGVIVVVFLLHEFGHKFVAQHFGCYAVYKMWPMGLFLGIVTGLLGGFVFAAPGAVYISPYNHKKFAFNVARIGKKEFGLISLAGPAVNIATGFIGIGLINFFNYSVLYTITRIAFFLAIFNLIPVPPLDGSKILAWDKKYWFASIILAVSGYIIFGLLA